MATWNMDNLNLSQEQLVPKSHSFFSEQCYLDTVDLYLRTAAVIIKTKDTHTEHPCNSKQRQTS